MIATDEAVTLFSALSDRNRLEITSLLATRGPMNAGRITAEFSISASAVSQHLRVLRDAHVVDVRRERQMRIYEVNQKALGTVQSWASHLHAKLQARYERLETLLSEEE